MPAGRRADISGFMARWPKGLPPFQTTYDEGLKVGYKWYDAEKKPVLFPFGFGLSYTTYAYSGLTREERRRTIAVTFTVKNTGKRAGTEIAQVYASLPDAAGEPPKRLIGWARVDLAPGESKQRLGSRRQRPPHRLRRSLRLLEAGSRQLQRDGRRLFAGSAAYQGSHPAITASQARRPSVHELRMDGPAAMSHFCTISSAKLDLPFFLSST